MVFVVSAGVAARGGIIIKSADVTERGSEVTDVVFDKTGTLTQGNLEVAHRKHFPAPTSSPDSVSLVIALLNNNQHPVSRAVSAALE